MIIKLGTALRAGYTFFYSQTNELDRTVENIKFELDAIEKGDWKCEVVDFESLQGDPDEIMSLLKKAKPYTAFIAKNLNWFMSSPNGDMNYTMVQYLQNRFDEFSSRECRKALIIISDDEFNKAIPSCLAKEFITIDFPLPDKKEIMEILESIIEAAKESPKFKSPNKKIKDDLVESALGLTKRGVGNAFAYSIIENNGKLDPKVVSSIRSSEINDTSGLTVGSYDVGDILGYDNAKDYIKKAINNPDSRGVLLLGPPGVGKTHLAKWTSTVSSKLLIEFELAGVQGEGLYGQAENAMANALRVIRSIGNCVLFLDEIEKAIPSKSATNDTTGTRSFSQLLKFLSDSRPEGCFVIATCNDISKLPPEWVRSERFDVIFFADLPSEDEKQSIYDHYLSEYKVETGMFQPSMMEDWTGAEIKTACRLAKVMETNVAEASTFVVPIAKTMKSDIDYLRKWSKGRSVPATLASKTGSKTVKRVKRDIAV
jgi:AAA+ superfamily predicted ATPase